jgi:hypothetical protein
MDFYMSVKQPSTVVMAATHTHTNSPDSPFECRSCEQLFAIQSQVCMAITIAFNPKQSFCN